MKRLFATLLIVATLLSTVLFAMPLTSSAASDSSSVTSYPINSSTLTMYSAGRGIYISSEDGKTIIFNSEKNNAGNTFWSGAKLAAGDDISDGFTVEITNIQWDSSNDNAVTIVAGTGNPWCGNVEASDRNVTLLVKRDGSIIFWGAGYNVNHIYGKWAPISVTGKSIEPSATSFIYKCIPDGSGNYSFYVNDTLIHTIDSANHGGDAKFANLFTTPLNFGFQVLNGTPDGAGAYGKAVAGTLSYTVNKVESVGKLDDSCYPINSDTLIYKAGGGQGVSLSGKKINFNLSSASSSAPAYWSRAQMASIDDIKDGFVVKIRDIVWDANNNNAVAITYGNGSSMGMTSVSTTDSKFVLLVKKDGSVSLWGNGYNSNHVLGKWTHACVTVNNVLSAGATEFTYKLVPNEDLSVFTFYVNDTEIFSYDIAWFEANKSSHKYSIFSRLDTLNGFGFQVHNGTGSYDTGWVTLPVGTLSYTIDRIEKASVVVEEEEPAAEIKYEGTCGGNTTWAIDVEGKLIISGEGAMADYTRSTMPWYKYRAEVVKVVIRDGVTKIGAYVFYNHTNLVTADIADSVAAIGKNAFKGSGVALGTCGENLFWSFDADKKALNISGTGAMDDYTRSSMPWYSYRNDITTVSLGSGVSSIGSYAFYGFANLKSATIGSAAIGKNAFKGTGVALGSCGDNAIWIFNADTGVLSITGEGAMFDYTRSSTPWYKYKDEIKSVEISDGITYIGAYSFYQYPNLASVAYSNTASVGKNAFKGCSVVLYIPNSLTLSMYETGDKLSYGFTWNSAKAPVLPVVQIRKAGDAEYTEYSASVTEYTSYDVNKNVIYVYVCKAVVELEPGTEYFYRVVDNGVSADGGATAVVMDEISFTSVDPTKESFTFAAFSDSQNTSHSGANFNKVLGSISDVDFYLHGGDVCEDTSVEQYWTNMLDYNKDYLATTPIMVAAGNHDTTYKAGYDEIAKHFNYNIPDQNTGYGCYYSFDYGNARFIVLNTNDLTSGKLKEDQYNWLIEQLESNDKEWLIINMHNPIYSIGKWGSNPSQNGTALALGEQLVPVFAEYGVDLVIQGHDHNISRTHPIDADGNPIAVETEVIDGITYNVSPDGPVYIMNGHSGGSTGTVVDYDSSLYAYTVAGTRLSWAEITVEEGKLTVDVKYISSDGVTVKSRDTWGIVK